LYTEVEGLSKLWEGLEQTMKAKVYELKDGELRMSRLATEVSPHPQLVGIKADSLESEGQQQVLCGDAVEGNGGSGV
jgi:hypothetical protein